MSILPVYDYDIFLSHSPNKADAAWTAALAKALELEDKQGRKLRVFFKAWDTDPGEDVSSPEAPFVESPASLAESPPAQDKSPSLQGEIPLASDEFPSSQDKSP
jgi:hypothetical protein